MAYNFLGLTNRVMKAMNEVELDSTNFASVIGFHADAKDAINQAILDIYREEDYEWPFAFTSTTFITTVGQLEYTKSASIHKPDWDSFSIRRPFIVVSSITRSGTTATVVTATAHQLNTGDFTTIKGATPSGYNGDVEVTRIDSTTYTYTVPSSLSTPATGTIYSIPKWSEKKLTRLDYDGYRKQGYEARDREAVIKDANSIPSYIVQKTDNNFIISSGAGAPDKQYTIYYEGFTLPTALTDYDDVPEIPEAYEQVIIDKALYYAYMYRNNIEEADRADDRYEKNVNKMRRALIPLSDYMRFE